MSEFSAPWDGTSLGDASSAPYDGSIEFALWVQIWSNIMNQSVDTNGVLMGALNGLQATGAATPVAINTGYAIVNGTIYQNTTTVSTTIPTPVTSTRIDRMVLRKDWGLGTVRITRIAGVEGGSAPAITQVSGTTWDAKLFQISITTGGVITLTDERQPIGDRPGDYKWTSTTAARDGWVEALGTAKSRTGFPVLNFLMSKLSYPYGTGDGATTFNIPNHQGRAATMYDPSGAVITSFTTMGVTIGSQTHTMTSAESYLVSHAHAGSTVGVGTLTLPDHNHNIPYATAASGALTITNAYTNGSNAGNLISGAVTSNPAINGSPSLSIAASSSAPGAAMSLMQPALADECLVFMGGLAA